MMYLIVLHASPSLCLFFSAVHVDVALTRNWGSCPDVIGSVAVQTHAARQLHNATLALRSVAGHMGVRARHMTDVFTCYSRVPHSSLRSDPRLLITSALDLN